MLVMLINDKFTNESAHLLLKNIETISKTKFGAVVSGKLFLYRKFSLGWTGSF